MEKWDSHLASENFYTMIAPEKTPKVYHLIEFNESKENISQRKGDGYHAESPIII